ncbi:hypothetical protein ABW19_dt0207500 [Dactylella cylindrospora]|nr:hypothetical protein ABW19_dt0207500 [Dactylella cylindrospora]
MTSNVNTKNSVSLSVSFPDIDWDMMQMAYGWAGLQFQAWVRGYLSVTPPLDKSRCSLIIHTKQAQEIWIDNVHYFGGDVYGYQKAPIVLPLSDKTQQRIINLRAFNDIRMFGGRKPPRIDIDLVFDVTCETLAFEASASVFPDIIDEKLAGEYASIVVRNDGEFPLDILGIKPEEDSVDLGLVEQITISAFQSRPVKLKLRVKGAIDTLTASIIYKTNSGSQQIRSLRVPLKSLNDPYSPHKYTYIHPSGIVSYGVIRPPSTAARHGCEKSKALPVLLSLHGAGVDTDSPMSRNSFEALPDLCAWLVIPSGVTPWSGDDWHTWGLADAEAAIAAINDWIKYIDWEGPGADATRWFVSGHSNGGQGAWYTLINRNDKVIGGTPISGYLSIPGYVPYDLWAELEPQANSILQSSMNTYKLNLLVENLAGTPIFQEHGEADDNVPVFHSRRMFELLGDTVQLGDFENAGYNELPKTGHWFDGIMTYGHMGDFLTRFFGKSRRLPGLQDEFSVIVGNPGAMGSRGGIRVLQLIDPTIYGRLKVAIDRLDCTWKIETVNIRRFELNPTTAASRALCTPSKAVVDEQGFDSVEKTLFFLSDVQWNLPQDTTWTTCERYGDQLGGLQAILNSKGLFTIVYQNSASLRSEYQHKALEISRNLFQYYSADTRILPTGEYQTGTKGNLVLIGHLDKSYFPEELRTRFPISQSENGDIMFRLRGGESITYPPQPGLGLIFLFPLPKNNAVGVLVWGSDADGLRKAARLFPIRTGVSQPDFILLGPESGWKGAAGALALGTFDSDWQITEGSYFRKS